MNEVTTEDIVLNMSQEELDKKYRKRVYEDKVTIVKLSARIKNEKTQIVLTDSNGMEYTYKLTKTVKMQSERKDLGFDIEEEKTEQVKAHEIEQYLPEVYRLMRDYLKKNPSVDCIVSYSQRALKFNDDVKIYRFFFDLDVDLLYSPQLFSDGARLMKMQEIKAKSEEKRKAQEVDL